VWAVDGWPEDATFTLELAPGITSFDGEVIAEPWSTTFTSRPPGEEGCGGGCATARPGGALVLPILALVVRRRRRR
jgi:hypothetical protein